MPDTVDDFMRRFGGNDTIDDREAEMFHERFASRRDEDRDFDTATYNEGAAEYLGRLPDEEFRSTAGRAIHNAPPEQRSDLLGGLLGSLTGGGSAGGGAGGLEAIAGMLGLGSSDPRSMSDDDATRVIDYARRKNPEALRRTVEEKPWFLKALGSPVVRGALVAAATKLIANRTRR